MSARQSRFYDRMRDPASITAARGGATAEGFGALRGRKYARLVSYRRSGDPVPTPVCGPDGADEAALGGRGDRNAYLEVTAA